MFKVVGKRLRSGTYNNVPYSKCDVFYENLDCSSPHEGLVVLHESFPDSFYSYIDVGDTFIDILYNKFGRPVDVRKE